MKVYDCFPFFNELDILEIRLQELWDVVDVFVLAESNVSHSGKPKEYIFENNKERFAKYASKIRRVQVDDMPDTTDSWVREKYQRWSLSKGVLEDLKPEDIVITSDLDEVPRAEAILMIKEDENNYDRYILGMPMFQFRINYMKVHDRTKQNSIMVARGRCYTNGNQEREYTFPWNTTPNDTVIIEHGGWHFTYFGDDEHAVTKIKNFAHTETDVPRFTVDKLTIDYMIENKFGLWGLDHQERFEYVVVDDYFPKCITDNLEKYKHMIIPDAQFHVTDLYREGE
jgi:beta-1,4-mannosyl-glycoprotein beta-1,4-N-acetylglucosaminyltransferase